MAVVDAQGNPVLNNVGSRIVANEPALPMSQPPVMNTVQNSTLPTPPVPPKGAVPSSPPTPPVPSPGMRASPDQPAVPMPTSTQRGPSSGVSTPVDEALMRAKADAQVDQAGDALSPTTMVLNYLRSQGLPRTSENVRRALEANARDPSTIQGLVNQAPPTETAPAQTTGRGGGGGGAKPAAKPTEVAKTDTPAAKTDQGGGISAADLAPYILGAGGAGAAYYLARRLAGKGGAGGQGAGTPAESVPATPGNRGARTPEAEYVGRGNVPNRGRTIDVGPEAITADTQPRRVGADSTSSSTGENVPENPQTRAINKATSPTASPENQQQTITDERTPKVTIDQHVTDADVRAAIRTNRIQVPPGMSEEDFISRILSRTGAPNVQFSGPRSASTAAEAAALAEANAARRGAQATRGLIRR